MARSLPSGAVSDDLELALALADVADAITLDRFRAEDLVVETKPDLTPVTEADRAVEQALRERLAELHPGDSVLGEEFGQSEAGAGTRRWIVDPIDGTKNYVRGIPVWATLLALAGRRRDDRRRVSAPALGRRWWAARGDGRVRRRRPARRRPATHRASPGCASSGDAQLCFPGLDDWKRRRPRRCCALAQPLLALARLRRLLALHAASPRAPPTSRCEPVVSLWDLAAPQVIVEEAGGRFTDLGGVPTAAGGDAIATNGTLHDAALAIVGR